MKWGILLSIITLLLSACTVVPVPVAVVTPTNNAAYHAVQTRQASVSRTQPTSVTPLSTQAPLAPTPVTSTLKYPARQTPSTPTAPTQVSNLMWLANKLQQNTPQDHGKDNVRWDSKQQIIHLGIAPFSWYPQTPGAAKDDSFPEFIQYLRSKKHPFPAWLSNRPHRGAPWKSEQAFKQAANDLQMRELKHFMANSRNMQANFLAERLHYKMPYLLKKFTAEEQSRIMQNYQVMLKSPRGLYPLLDYINFQGDGSISTQRYKNQGWGLVEVLLNMRPVQPGQGALDEFAAAAEDVLLQRIANSPAQLREARWLQAWRQRLNSYRPAALASR